MVAIFRSVTVSSFTFSLWAVIVSVVIVSIAPPIITRPFVIRIPPPASGVTIVTIIPVYDGAVPSTTLCSTYSLVRAHDPEESAPGAPCSGLSSPCGRSGRHGPGWRGVRRPRRADGSSPGCQGGGQLSAGDPAAPAGGAGGAGGRAGFHRGPGARAHLPPLRPPLGCEAKKKKRRRPL